MLSTFCYNINIQAIGLISKIIIKNTLIPFPFAFIQAGHEIFGKENMQYYPSVGLSGRSESATTTESSPQEQSRPGSRNMRRKVLRKRDGASRVFDESFASTDSGKFHLKQ